MVVPDLRLDVNLDHANAAFHKAAGHQAAPSIGSGEFVIQAVHLACRFGLLGDIERVGSFDLHACGKLVRGDACVEIGLAGTLVVNTFFMAIGVFGALLYVAHKFTGPDAQILVALYFIVLQFLIITALTLFFSSFSSPLLSAVFAFSLFVIGSFAEDLRGFAGIAHGLTRWLATGAAYLVPNFSALNVISSVAHAQPVPGQLILYNSAYALIYATMAICGAVLVFERRNLK